MTEVNGTEEVIVEVTETPVVYSGVAFKVNQKINVLKEVLAIAVELESGLDTQAAIKRVSTELRSNLLPISRELHGIYSDVIGIRSELLGGVGEVQKVSQKDKLLKLQEETAAKLAALG